LEIEQKLNKANIVDYLKSTLISWQNEYNYMTKLKKMDQKVLSKLATEYMSQSLSPLDFSSPTEVNNRLELHLQELQKEYNITEIIQSQFNLKGDLLNIKQKLRNLEINIQNDSQNYAHAANKVIENLRNENSSLQSEVMAALSKIQFVMDATSETTVDRFRTLDSLIRKIILLG